MKLKLAFICVHNSCRSQMAEAWMNDLGSEVFEVYSAGTEEYPQVKAGAVEVMTEAGIDVSNQYPKLLSDIPKELDLLITMGCNVSCPFVPTRFSEDWGLSDPSGGPIEGFRQTRDLIKEKCIQLIQRVKDGSITLKD